MSMSSIKLQKNQIKNKFLKSEVVWAKINNYPWWPALITCTPSKNNSFYKVDFIGDRSYAFLPESKITKYIPFRQQYSSNKKPNKNFLNALTIASNKYKQSMLKKTLPSLFKDSTCPQIRTSSQKQQLQKQIEFSIFAQNIQQIKQENKKQTEYEQLQQQQHNFPYNKNAYQSFERQNKVNNIKQKPIHYIDVKLSNEQQKLQEDDNKEKYIQVILARYKLDLIPKKSGKDQLENYQNEQKRIYFKKKYINKQQQKQLKYNQAEQDKLTQEKLLIRKLHNYLKKKINNAENARTVALALQQQLLIHPHNKFQCLKSLLEWIQMSNCQTIMDFHSEWLNFYREGEKQRQKQSYVTIDFESEEQLVK